MFQSHQEFYGNSKILLDELEDYSRKMIRNFPKYERHLTHDDIRRYLSEIADSLVRIWNKFYKKTTIVNVIIILLVFKNKIESCHRWQLINDHQLAVWTEKVEALISLIKDWNAYCPS